MEMLAYWVDVLYRLLNLMQIDFASEVAACVKAVNGKKDILVLLDKVC